MYQVSSNSFGAKFISPDHQTKTRISFFGLFRSPPSQLRSCRAFAPSVCVLLFPSSFITHLLLCGNVPLLDFHFYLPLTPRTSFLWFVPHQLTRCSQLLSPSFASSPLSLTRLSSLSLFTSLTLLSLLTLLFYLLTFSFTHLHCHSFS
jgi:hypothetical protein